jgi:hypothetical protein
LRHVLRRREAALGPAVIRRFEGHACRTGNGSACTEVQMKAVGLELGI